MTECSFCKIIAGKLPINKIYENENVLVFAPLEEDIIAKGHMLVIPKKHYIDIYDIPKEELYHIVDAIKNISCKLKNFFQGRATNAPVFLLYMIPRAFSVASSHALSYTHSLV